MYVIQRRKIQTGQVETLLSDGTWTEADGGNFYHSRDWKTALLELLSLKRDHKTYDYFTHEIAVAVPFPPSK